MAIGDQHSMAGGNGTGHPGLEMLAAYTDRKLTAAVAATVERHASVCAECRETLVDAAAFRIIDDQADIPRHGRVGAATPFRRITKPLAVFLAAAAVLVLAVRAVAPERLPRWIGGTAAQGRLSPLVAAAETSPTRFTEGRLTGGFPYAPAPPLIRGVDGRAPSPEVRIAAAEVEQRASLGDTAEELAALGVARLSTGEWDGAVAGLEQAATLAPADARIQSDLAAVYLARARNREADYASALAAAERALAVQEPPLEALFNRAVALERMGRRADAAQAWQDYLARDASSPWAAEARTRARALSPSTATP